MPARRRRTPTISKTTRAARDRLAMARLDRMLEPLRLAGVERQRRLRAGLTVEPLPE